MRNLIAAPMLAVAVLLSLTVRGQKTIKEGDEFPDLLFENVFNYSKSKLKFSELRPKLVIIEFWSTTCISCIQSFPKIEKLQEEFSNEIQVVMVTKESKSKVDSFLLKRPRIKLPNTIHLMEDRVLNAVFPRATVALNVWVDSSGRVAFITESFQSNETQVLKFLKGDSINMTRFRGKPSYRQTLFDEKTENSLRYFSYIANYNHVNIGSNFSLNGIHISEHSLSAAELFLVAFDEGWKKGFRRPNRFFLEIKDSFKYVRPKAATGRLGEWLKEYCYSYQLFLPHSKKGQEYKIMQNDLLRYFDLEPRIEKRTIPALALVKSSSQDLLVSKGGKFFNSFRRNDDFSPLVGGVRKMQNVPFSRLHGALNGIFEYSFGMPVIDSTYYNGNIDIEVSGPSLDTITTDLNSANLLRQELRNYGLELRPLEIEIEVLILRDSEFAQKNKGCN